MSSVVSVTDEFCDYIISMNEVSDCKIYFNGQDEIKELLTADLILIFNIK